MMKQFSEKPKHQKKSLKKISLISAGIGVLIAIKFGSSIAPDNPGHHGSGLTFAVAMLVIGPLIVIACTLLGLLLTFLYNKIIAKQQPEE